MAEQAPCGDIVLLREVYEASDMCVGRTLRVTGTVIGMSCERVCLIEHEKRRLWVETSLLEGVRMDCLYQFIGLLSSVDDASCRLSPAAKALIAQSTDGRDERERLVCLKATIVRVAEGLDMRLFEQALMQRRKFMQFMAQKL